MSFRCEICNIPQPMGHAPDRVVTKTRTKNYQDTSKVGIESVEEKNCCPGCAETVTESKREEQLALVQEAARLTKEQEDNVRSRPSYD
jgi:hypothetical protein